jgi:hypothetical protein
MLGLPNQVPTTNSQPSPTSQTIPVQPQRQITIPKLISTSAGNRRFLRQPGSTRISSHNNSCIQPCNTVKLLADWRGASVILLRLEPLTVPLTGCYILGRHLFFRSGRRSYQQPMSKMLAPPDLRVYNLWQSTSSSSFSNQHKPAISLISHFLYFHLLSLTHNLSILPS